MKKNKLKVGIDISEMNPLSMNRGIGFYTDHLFKSLIKYTDLDVVLVERQKDVKNLDLIHYPFFDFFSPTLPLIKKLPVIVTIHDVIPLVFPKHYPSGMRGRIILERQKFSLKTVQAVITDSISSKLDIMKYLNVAENKISTIYLSPAERFKKERDFKTLLSVKEKYNLPEKFVLYVGNINWNKNLLNLTKASIDANVDLYLIGDAFKTEKNLEHPELNDYKIWLQQYSTYPKVHIIDTYPKDDIVGIYNLAEALLLPSFYEGFGLPILEAQACGTPVITSDISSMPEVSGGGAILIDPNKPDKITAAIKSLEMQSVKGKLIKEGLRNVEKFSWKKVAEETLLVYQNIAP
ncbi:glycosyltransferase family 4 protein [Candidatus Daviesbacteria bacterium]|nr:glycosyltransferase family 4 protein [Candidatus Daviesbacteria bacterium]